MIQLTDWVAGLTDSIAVATTKSCNTVTSPASPLGGPLAALGGPSAAPRRSLGGNELIKYVGFYELVAQVIFDIAYDGTVCMYLRLALLGSSLQASLRNQILEVRLHFQPTRGRPGHASELNARRTLCK